MLDLLEDKDIRIEYDVVIPMDNVIRVNIIIFV